MANINHIRISGVTYSIEDIGAQQSLSAKQDTLVSGTNIKTINNQSLLGSGNIAIQGGSGATVTEVTQAEYDALVTAGTVDLSTLYIITDATAVDISQYYTSAQTESAITQAVSGKVDTSAITSSVTSASTDSEIPTAKAVFDAMPQGASYSAGTNIDITNDTISCTLPLVTKNLWNGKSLVGIDAYNDATQPYSFVYGFSNNAHGERSAVFGSSNVTNGKYSFAACSGNLTNNPYEVAFGGYNNSVSASTTFGDSGNTIFSVGNGTSNSARHNAFEIRQNGDIYCSDGTNDVKLQDTITATAANTTALGGLKLQQITQTDYDALVSGGTVDNSTLYVIVN